MPGGAGHGGCRMLAQVFELAPTRFTRDPLTCSPCSGQRKQAPKFLNEGLSCIEAKLDPEYV